MNSQIFRGCIPALMTPCLADRLPNYPALVRKGRDMMDAGMTAVVYCGFETKADMFFDLNHEFPNLVGFKEFGAAESLTYAAEHITQSDRRTECKSETLRRITAEAVSTLVEQLVRNAVFRDNQY